MYVCIYIVVRACVVQLRFLLSYWKPRDTHAPHSRLIETTHTLHYDYQHLFNYFVGKAS